MTARKRKDTESFASYRNNLKKEARQETRRPRRYLCKHKIHSMRDDTVIGGTRYLVLGLPYKREATRA